MAADHSERKRKHSQNAFAFRALVPSRGPQAQASALTRALSRRQEPSQAELVSLEAHRATPQVRPFSLSAVFAPSIERETAKEEKHSYMHTPAPKLKTPQAG